MVAAPEVKQVNADLYGAETPKLDGTRANRVEASKRAVYVDASKAFVEDDGWSLKLQACRSIPSLK